MDDIAPTTIETSVGAWGVKTALGFPLVLDEYRLRVEAVEPPSSDDVAAEMVRLDSMGTVRSFPLKP